MCVCIYTLLNIGEKNVSNKNCREKCDILFSVHIFHKSYDFLDNLQMGFYGATL